MNIIKPEILRHYSPNSPDIVGSYLQPHDNYDMYKNEYSKRIFATSLISSDQVYFFLHCSSSYFYVNEDDAIIILKSYEDMLNSLDHKAYIYNICSKDFVPVVDKNNDFCGEWVSYNPVSVFGNNPKMIRFNDIIEENDFGKGMTIFYSKTMQDYKNIRSVIDSISDYTLKKSYLFENSSERDDIKRLRLLRNK